MKRTFLLVGLVLPLFLSAQGKHVLSAQGKFVLCVQDKYVLKGKIGTLNPPAKVFLTYTLDTQAVTDSAVVKDGVFEFSGQVDDITLATLIMDYKRVGVQTTLNGTKVDWEALFLQQGTTVVSSADSLSKAIVTGTKANEDYMRYKALTKPINDAVKALQAEYNAATNEQKNSQQFVDDIQKKSAGINQQSKELNDKFIDDNPDAYIGFQSLIDRINAESYPDADYFQAQFSKLSTSIRESKAGVAYQKRLDGLKAVAVGAMAPDFEQPDTSGTPVKLSSFRGKYVLLDFWASWCGPCRNENPNVVKAYNNFREKNFTILSVSLDQPGKKDSWLKAIHADGLIWNHLSDLKFWNNEAAVLYGVRAIPQNLLIDPSGKIIARNIFGDDLQNKLKEILGGM